MSVSPSVASPVLAVSRGRKRSFSELQAGSIEGPRPQDFFPEPPDNSNEPFQPIIHPFLEGKHGRLPLPPSPSLLTPLMWSCLRAFRGPFSFKGPELASLSGTSMMVDVR